MLVLLCIQLTAFRCSILLNPLTWEAFRYKFAASDYGTATRGKNCAFFDCCNHTLSYSTGERNQQGKLPDLADIEHIRHRRFCFKWVFVRNERFASSTWDNQRKNTCIHWGGRAVCIDVYLSSASPMSPRTKIATARSFACHCRLGSALG